ncbi:MAG: alkaline phosphatase family protein [Sporichthyaceae bacterium]
MTDLPPPPRYGGGSLADVLPAVLTSLGLPGERPGPGLPTTGRLVVLLVDGLGTRALREHAALAPFLAGLLDSPASAEITTVFPSTTPIALTSLGTGLTPGEHGVTGLHVRLGSGQRVNMLAIPAETDLRVFQPVATAFERAAAAGVAVTRVGPAVFDGQGLTEAGLRGGDYVAAETVGERVAATHVAVRRSAPALVYVYYGDLDATGHRAGYRSDDWRAELAQVDVWAAQVAAGLPQGTTLLVTSDHGMLDVPFENRWDVATTPALDMGVAALSGDLRGLQLHVRDGALPDVRAAWEATLGDAFWLVDRDTAVDAGYYGPVVRDEVRARLGDLLALARRDHVVLDSRTAPPFVLRLVGMHGGLTPDEIEVPLLVQHC